MHLKPRGTRGDTRLSKKIIINAQQSTAWTEPIRVLREATLLFHDTGVGTP